jgi:hypothetical protein
MCKDQKWSCLIFSYPIVLFLVLKPQSSRRGLPNKRISDEEGWQNYVVSTTFHSTRKEHFFTKQAPLVDFH